MKVIKELGRNEGWRHGAQLVSLDRPILVRGSDKRRQTKRVIVSAATGWMYPVNRREQIIGDPIQSVRK